ncbi:MAG TPA: SapC family protein [Caulobacteraceae bacterium]
MAANVAQPNPVTGNVLLHERPEPLDAKRHGNLGLSKTDKPFGFVAKQRFAPLHVGEFGTASVNYPIIFAGEAQAPLAVVGIAYDRVRPWRDAGRARRLLKARG